MSGITPVKKVEILRLSKLKAKLKMLTSIDQWLRRRIRMCIWKSWKRPKTRIKCGIKPYWARIYGNSSKGDWANAEGIMHHAATNDKLRAAGYPCLMDYYVRLHAR